MIKQETLEAEFPPLTLQMRPAFEMTDEQFYKFCQINRDLRIERTPAGEMIIMSPSGGITGSRNAEITTALRLWAKQDKTGIAFDSSTGFNLPNGATRSPDASWVHLARLATLTAEQKRKFIPLCPDFVIELRSSSDNLKDLQEKMEEYRENGARLGWLIDPEKRQIFIYQPGTMVEHLQNPELLSAEPELPGFTLNLSAIWEPGF